ncbi:hypothetical protein H4R34_003828 [Dimargaris verticillata]|uniref:Ca3427-like PBP 2 domain-containing protein n=1 Tax=Dimargaris verticillata TaxID=2761393 RepID=A0A9W8ECS8_9FUNG|nr:hypothetical protein H4R34_003828 [Dimargaris verticillata]
MKLRLGVVPEHFSSPVFLYEQSKAFAARGLDVEVVVCEAGTGDMVRRLQSGELDLAFCVTEGLTTAVANDGGQSIQIVGTYVESPLCWSVSTGYNNHQLSMDQLNHGGTIGISRFGSGSHIMALYMAQVHNEANTSAAQPLSASPFTFKVLHNLAGLAEGAQTGAIDAFLWEVFTTKHLYDAHALRPVGQVVPPWSSFTIAARVDQVLSTVQGAETVRLFLAVLNDAVADFLHGMAESGPQPSLAFLMDRFNYSQDDALAWFKTVRYPQNVSHVSRDEISRCVKTLTAAGAIKATDVDLDALVNPTVAQWQ